MGDDNRISIIFICNVRIQSYDGYRVVAFYGQNQAILCIAGPASLQSRKMTHTFIGSVICPHRANDGNMGKTANRAYVARISYVDCYSLAENDELSVV